MTTIIQKIKKSIREFFDIEELDPKDIPMMKYSEGQEPTDYPPVICPGSKNSARLIYRRR